METWRQNTEEESKMELLGDISVIETMQETKTISSVDIFDFKTDLKLDLAHSNLQEMISVCRNILAYGRREDYPEQIPDHYEIYQLSLRSFMKDFMLKMPEDLKNKILSNDSSAEYDNK